MKAGVHRRAREGESGGQIEVDAERLDLVGQQAPQVRVGPTGTDGGGPGEGLQRIGGEQSDHVGTTGDELTAGGRDPPVGGQGQGQRARRTPEVLPGRASLVAPEVGRVAIAAGRELRNVHEDHGA